MASNILQSLSDKIPGALGTKAVYGEQVDLDGTKLIPVAYAAFGFGAGEGSGTDEVGKPGEGSGGGGGGVTIPLGAYVSRGGDVRFEFNPVVGFALLIPFTYVAGKVLAKIIRAAKR